MTSAMSIVESPKMDLEEINDEVQYGQENNYSKCPIV